MASQDVSFPHLETPMSPLAREVSAGHSIRARVRNITGISIRNFTPFPMRDAETSSLAISGPILSDSVDDIELALNRRRSRRISTNSLNTIRSIRSAVEPSRTDLSQFKGDASPGRPRANSRTVRKSLAASHQRPQRERASSSASNQLTLKYVQGRQHGSSNVEDPSPPASPIVVSASGDDIQRPLERVMASRLVETFLTLEALPEEEESSKSPSSPKSTYPSNRVSVSKVESSSGRGQPSTTSPRTKVTKLGASPKLVTSSLNKSSSRPSSPANPRSPKSRQSHASSSMPRPTSPRVKASEVQRSISTSHSLPTPAPSPSPESGPSNIPFYISAFHRPSTNPSFASLDARNDFATWTNLSAHRFRASLWGRAGEWGRTQEENVKGKSPEHLVDVHSVPTGEWDVLVSWEVDMDDLKPVPEEYSLQPALLPSNTFIVRLSPSGGLYYLPGGQVGPTTIAPSESRASSPDGGYSDTEVDNRTVRRGKRRSYTALKTEAFEKSRRETKMKNSAGFGNLLKLVTLQTAVADTKLELEELVQTCDHFLDENPLPSLQRELGQKEENLRGMSEQHQAMKKSTNELRAKIVGKREALRGRRELLDDARHLHSEEKLAFESLKVNVVDQRRRHTELLNRLTSVRTALLQTVSTIFPIDPIEPKDLLFGIVSLPLPIPTGPNDPAPPQILAGDSSYNDEMMASALGYVAQVTNLITAYLGDMPIYPVICQGSRSLIKDPISAMMGPRMFPLYAKGVDTYRFEYGVFLLNKNIEMLMSERDLRALDLRHTLPNLKNLLLTLTSGEAAVLKPRPRKKISALSHSMSLATDLDSLISDPLHDPTPSPLSSEQESEHSEHSTGTQIEPTLPTTPTASKIVIEPEEPAISMASTASSSTNIESISTARKSFYSPLASFLRTRYPSVRTPSSSGLDSGPIAVKVEVETPPPSEPANNQINDELGLKKKDDADETSTIKAPALRSRFALFHRAAEEEAMH